MALFTPGTGTLRSTTLESALLEAIMLLLGKEQDAAINPNNQKRVTFNLNQQLVASGTCNFLATETLDTTNDSIRWTVDNYLASGFVFSAGNGTLKAGNLPAAIIAIAKRIRSLEVQPTKNATGQSNINLVFSSQESAVTLYWKMPVQTVTDSNGRVAYNAVPYLID